MTSAPRTTIGFRISCRRTRRPSLRDSAAAAAPRAPSATATARVADAVAIYEYRICGSSQP